MLHSIVFALVMVLVPLIGRSGMNSWTMASITAGVKSIGRGLLTPQSVLIGLTSFLLSYLGVLDENSYIIFVILLFAATVPVTND